MQKFKSLLKLFICFFKIGLFTFGGGYAMISVIQHDVVEKKKWISDEEFMDIIAIAESTPGPVSINTSTYVGYKVGGFLGSLFATLGTVIPSFAIIFGLSFAWEAFSSIKYVSYAFKGINACVAFLILSAGFKMIKKLKKNWLNIILCFSTLVLMVCFTIFNVHFSSIYFILIGAFVGLMVFLIPYSMNKAKKENINDQKDKSLIEEKEENDA